MSIASKTQKTQPRPEPEEMLEWRPPALTNTPLSHAHTASPRPLARTHDTNTKRNRNRFPDWGSPASINSPQSPILQILEVRYRGTNNKGVLDRTWTKRMVLKVISSTLKFQFTVNHEVKDLTIR